MIKLMALFLGLGFCATGLALQTKAIQDNTRILLPISSAEITRITVHQDRIRELIGPKGAYQLQPGESQGDVYLQPKVAHPFSVFIETERGHHLALLLQPMARPADSIALMPQELPHVR